MDENVSFKYIMNVLNQLNQRNYGPFIARSDTITAKMLNIQKSVAVEVKLDKLLCIESFMHNFN